MRARGGPAGRPAFRSLGTFRGESAFGTWLTALALNSYRSRLRAHGPPLLSLEPAGVFAAEPIALRDLQARERAEAVRRAVFTLPERYREAIVVYYFEERDLADSARTLGVAEGTLKARLHRARELLQRRCAALDAAAAGAAKEAT